MKFTVDVDCTPDEARRFLGLPEVAAMQERLMAGLEAKLSEAIGRSEPHKLMEQWLPLGMKGIEQWQGLWTQMAEAAAGGRKR